MTIDEAINRLTTLIVPEPSALYPRETEAVKLGIEAMIEIKDLRMGHCKLVCLSLPGETEN